MAMEGQVKHRRNLLGAGGWFYGGNYKIERYLYTLHRVTGLGLLLFAIFHMTETTFFRLPGKSVWDMTTSFLKNPAFEVGLLLVSFAFVIHALNGLRLILQEFGITLGKPKRPIFPYQDALRKRRSTMVTIVVIMIILLIVFLINWIGGR